MPVCVSVLVRNELDLTALYGLEGHLGELAHLQEPLGREPRLDYRIGSFGITYRRNVFLHLLEAAGLLKHLLDFLPCDKPVLSHQNLSLLIQFAVIVNDICNRKIVPETYFIVIDVMSRSHLEASGTETDLYI